MKAQNIFLDENTGGKGRYFKARILQPGLVKYSFGVCLLEKETIDKFINDFVGCPVIINHNEVTKENADELVGGHICHVWFDNFDSWYWVDGIIDDQDALNKIDDGWNVSCQYEITEYSNNTDGKLHNGNPYDKVILNGKPEHLAIVKTPRYENAMIAVNALDLTAENGFITIDAGDENERVIWVPFNVLSDKARKRINEIADNYKEGQETKFDFSHTRVKPSEEQIKYLKDTVKDIQNKYKFKGIAQVEISSELNKGSLGVCASPDNCSVISLSPQLYNGKHDQSRWEKGVESGFHPKGTGEMIKSVLVHEIGHAITCNSKNDKFWGEIEKIRSEYLKEVKKKDTKHPDFISGYARTNKFEFVAEAFCQGTLAKNYGKYTKQVMESINKHFSSNYQQKLFDAQNENKNEDFMWLEEYGLGYPIDEEAFEEFNKIQNKDKETADNSISEIITKAINELKDTDMFNKLFNRKKEFEMNKDELKEIFADCLQEVLLAKNEEEKEDELKKAADNEEDEEEDKKAENKKCKNEDVDKREIIRQIMAIAGKEEASEDVKTIAKLAEKLAYDKSEAATADNGKKAKCEDDEDEDKEEAKNKAKNAIDDMKGLFASAGVAKAASKYVTQSDAIELGNQLF